MQRIATHPLAKLLAAAALTAVWVILLVHAAQGGGPLYVAGVSYFDPAVKGQPLTWAQGNVLYYTDLGDLSPLLPQASANALVADAFSRWTNISTAAIAATPTGSLAEDVDGTNVTIVGGVLSMPADIQPSAVNNAVGIVYDFDGHVTDTLLGTGSSFDCQNNAVYGGVDSFTTGGNFAHALVILNGLCAQDPALLADFEYRLVRILGRVLGLATAQANLNVWTGNPVPTAADQAGFPAKHATDLLFCLPITKCLSGADQPKLDDRAALGRLYPVTPQNQGNFPGKTLFSATTARIHGTVYFPGSGVSPGQGMQGVNIVARWIDPRTLQPSRTFVATSVSGFLYRGYAGNSITGPLDATGTPFNQWGSDDPTWQGFFDLAGLEFPDGSINTSYEITVETVDPLLSSTVGPYAPLQVNPSGAWVPVVVPVSLGGDALQDLVMAGAAVQTLSRLDSQDYLNPAAVPRGEWVSEFNLADSTNYYWISAQANRTLSVEVEAVDENGNATENKAQPVIGMWSMAAPPGTPPPALTPSPFNAGTYAETRLDAQLFQSTSYRIGVTDWRGDGRPDYEHHLRVLYGDFVTPDRISVAGSEAVRVQGLGFRPGMVGVVGSVAAPIVNFTANQVLLLTPALADGLQTVVVTDPTTGGFTTLTDAITAGAGATDAILLLPVPNPAIPVGGTTPNALQFLIVQVDGTTPVPGATVALSTTNGLTLEACGGASGCSVVSDGSGRVVTNASVTLVGPGLVTAQLAPASYSNPSTVVTTVTGTATSLDIAAVGQIVEVEQGATLSVPLMARVLNNGNPLPGRQINFQVAVGRGVLNAASVTTDANGNATNALAFTRVAVDVQVTACVAPLNAPCKTFSVGVVPIAALRIEAVSGLQQTTTEGQIPQPVIVRITDGAFPPNPVFGANATFQSVLFRGGDDGHTIIVDGEVVYQPSDPAILGAAKALLTSDIHGMAQLAPWASQIRAGEAVGGFVSADSGAQIVFSLQVLPQIVGGGLPGRSRRNGKPAGYSSPLSSFQNVGGAGFVFSELIVDAKGDPVIEPAASAVSDRLATPAFPEPVDDVAPAKPDAVSPAGKRPSGTSCSQCAAKACSLLE